MIYLQLGYWPWQCNWGCIIGLDIIGGVLLALRIWLGLHDGVCWMFAFGKGKEIDINLCIHIYRERGGERNLYICIYRHMCRHVYVCTCVCVATCV